MSIGGKKFFIVIVDLLAFIKDFLGLETETLNRGTILRDCP